MTLILALAAGILYSAGTWLVLQRTLTRIIIGLGLLGHGANLLLLLAGGASGAPPIIGSDGTTSGASTVADPLPQALALTAIVITFGVTAFLLALAYRSWLLTRDDEVEDDVEDRRIARLRGEAEDEVLPDLPVVPDRPLDEQQPEPVAVEPSGPAQLRRDPLGESS